MVLFKNKLGIYSDNASNHNKLLTLFYICNKKKTYQTTQDYIFINNNTFVKILKI